MIAIFLNFEHLFFSTNNASFFIISVHNVSGIKLTKLHFVEHHSTSSSRFGAYWNCDRNRQLLQHFHDTLLRLQNIHLPATDTNKSCNESTSSSLNLYYAKLFSVDLWGISQGRIFIVYRLLKRSAHRDFFLWSLLIFISKFWPNVVFRPRHAAKGLTNSQACFHKKTQPIVRASGIDLCFIPN